MIPDLTNLVINYLGKEYLWQIHHQNLSPNFKKILYEYPRKYVEVTESEIDLVSQLNIKNASKLIMILREYANDLTKEYTDKLTKFLEKFVKLKQLIISIDTSLCGYIKNPNIFLPKNLGTLEKIVLENCYSNQLKELTNLKIFEITLIEGNFVSAINKIPKSMSDLDLKFEIFNGAKLIVHQNKKSYPTTTPLYRRDDWKISNFKITTNGLINLPVVAISSFLKNFIGDLPQIKESCYTFFKYTLISEPQHGLQLNDFI
jgi:hypothetical protein